MNFTIFLAIGLLCVFEEFLAQSVEENLVTIGKKFKKFCLDNEGNKYKKNEKLYGACEEYTCTKSKKNVIWKATDLKTCCYEYGLWYPMYNIVYTEEYGPSLAMNYICDWELKVTPSMDIKGCSIMGKNVDPGQQVYWPEKCAMIACYNDENNFPTVDYVEWFEGTGCCEFDGYLFSDGDYANTPDGLLVQCCKGMINYVFPYINGTEPEFPGGEGSGTGGGGETGGSGPGEGSDTCTCGQRYGSTKIVGGQETEVNEYPWQVGLVSAGWGTSVWCGATLISDQWIMTAAHCTYDGLSAEDIEVLVGEHNYETDTETTALRMVISEIRWHEDYDSSTTDFDFSLLKLETPIDFTAYPHIRPACLPENDDNDYAGYPAIVSGWGTTSSGGDVSSYLQYVEVNVLSNAECSDKYGSSITKQMLCANVEGGGKDACQGDSGGPLVSRNPDLFELIGVVSWGAGCAEADYPGVYARMSKQLAWVADQTAGSWNTCGRCPDGEECGGGHIFCDDDLKNIHARMTASKTIIEVQCCNNGTSTNTTCGKGTSCADVCPNVECAKVVSDLGKQDHCRNNGQAKVDMVMPEIGEHCPTECKHLARNCTCTDDNHSCVCPPNSTGYIDECCGCSWLMDPKCPYCDLETCPKTKKK